MTANFGPGAAMPEFYFMFHSKKKISGKGRRGGRADHQTEQIGASGAPGSILIDSERGVPTF